jgi:hypothetical protein
VPRDDTARGARPTETEIAIVRDVVRYTVESVDDVGDAAVAEQRIRRAAEFADRRKLRDHLAQRRKLVASAVLYAGMPTPDVARLARLTDEGARKAVDQELGITRKRSDPEYQEEYDAARTELRPDIEDPAAVDELPHWGDLATRAKVSYREGEALRNRLMVRSHGLGVPRETLEEWTGLKRKRVTDILAGAPSTPDDDLDDPEEDLDVDDTAD